MALKERIEKMLNEQVNKEMYSAYLYYSMAVHCESSNFSGFAKWLFLQAKEEMDHANKLVKYILERSGNVTLEEIKKPKLTWESLEEAFKDAFEHEKFVSDSINNIVDATIEEKDHATNNMLQWFVAEQVEEEASAEEIYEKLKMINGNMGALMRFDGEMARRGE